MKNKKKALIKSPSVQPVHDDEDECSLTKLFAKL